MENGERFRSLDNEELAELLFYKTEFADGALYIDGVRFETVEDLYDWLEAEEDEE